MCSSGGEAGLEWGQCRQARGVAVTPCLDRRAVPTFPGSHKCREAEPQDRTRPAREHEKCYQAPCREEWRSNRCSPKKLIAAHDQSASVNSTVTRRMGSPFSVTVGALAPSTAHVSLYVGLSQTDAALGLTGANLWIYPSFDHDANVERFVRDLNAPLPVVYISLSFRQGPGF